MNDIEIAPGLSGVITFCDWLKKQRITYSLHHYGDDAITVFFTVVGARFEVQFYEDYWNFSYFTGSEDVFDNKKDLMALISERWSRD